MYLTSIFFIDSKLEEYEECLNNYDFYNIDKAMLNNAKIIIQDKIFYYKDIREEIEELFSNNRWYDIVSIQISPDLENSCYINPFYSKLSIRCFFESTINDLSDQVVLKLKLNRTVLGGWRVAQVEIVYYNPEVWMKK